MSGEWKIDGEPHRSAWRKELLRIYDEAQARRNEDPPGGSRVREPRRPTPLAPVTGAEVDA